MHTLVPRCGSPFARSACSRRHRYLLELQVDDAIYSVASYTSDARGEIALDTALTEFAEGVCVGANYDAPRPVTGTHDVKFWIKRDGNPKTGTSPGVKAGAPGASLRLQRKWRRRLRIHADGKRDRALLGHRTREVSADHCTSHDENATLGLESLVRAIFPLSVFCSHAAHATRSRRAAACDAPIPRAGS